tara:strand:- start:636 stop:1130 length:495 start_codon:yes stop_codon:yes gene_type:complete
MHKEDLIQNHKCFKPKLISLGVSHLSKCCELDEIALNGLWSKDQWRKELSDSARLCLGLMNQSQLIAFACGWIVAGELQITSIAVYPNYQRMGLGKAILSELLLKARSLGVKKATLEVKITNESAKALYKSLEFKIKGRRKQIYRDGSDALILWHDLIINPNKE